MDNSSSSIRWRLAGCGAMLAVTLSLTGCDSTQAKEFRQIAGPALQTGISSILDGVVDGFFAVVDPDTTASNGSTGGTTQSADSQR